MGIVANKINAYNVILEKMREYPNDIPLDDDGNISSAFREYIKLMFTPEEAEIVQHLDIKPLTVNVIAKRIGNGTIISCESKCSESLS
ncbi:MAG TPA: hypothetical protein ENH75_06135 [archaeon]|nr:hypothetical protein [archaeon]